MIIFNLIGLGMLAVCFLAAYGVGATLGATSEDVLMVIAGPLLLIWDVLYRRKQAQDEGWWYRPRAGGQLFFAPIWMLGLLWGAIGMARLLF